MNGRASARVSRVNSERQGHSAVAVPIGRLAGAVDDLSGGGGVPLDAVQVLADLGAGRDEHVAVLHRGAQPGEELFLEPGAEVAQFDLRAEVLVKEIAQTNARPGVIHHQRIVHQVQRSHAGG